MKADIHPQYYPQAQVVCACGNVFTTGSTKPTIHVELCSKCHPFYTGQEKLVDTVGRVEKFQKQQQAAAVIQTQKKVKKEEKQREELRPKTLKEMISALRDQA